MFGSNIISKKAISLLLRKLIIVVLVVATSLFVLDFYNSPFSKVVPEFMRFTVVAPVQERMNDFKVSFYGAINTFKNDYDSKKEEARLQGELVEKKIEIKLLKKLYVDAIKRNSLLGDAAIQDVSANMAVIIAHEPERHFLHLIINKGSVNDVEVGMPVVGFQKSRIAIVGFVSEVGKNSSLVQTILDQRTQISVEVLTIGSGGISRGQSVASQYLQLDFLDKKINGLTGLEVVTSGIGQKYPAGISVGKISYRIKKNYLIFQSAYVQPYINFFTLREVFLLPIPLAEEVDVEVEE